MPASLKPSEKHTRKNASSAGLASALAPRIRPLPAKVAKPRLADLAEAAGDAGLADDLSRALKENEALAPFLAAVMECSPFLRSLMLDDPARL
ncbi:MAG: hypothetical protein J0H63_12935, partial [Rhizobiales bacterium]|nr:hypothetical protein [Hyphomicrobiales bacterium]